MGYIGNQTSNAFSSMSKQDITGNGGANYTLTYAVANENEIEVFVNNVRQEPSVAYTVNDTALTMTGNVSSTDDFYVIYLGKALQTTVPPDGSVTSAKISYPLTTFSSTGIDDNATSTAITVDANQNVGIGTTTVTSGFKLEVTGDSRFGDAYNDDAVELGWSAGGSGSGFVQAYDRGASAFRDLALNNSITIKSDGNVGIGKTAPLGKLDVTGGFITVSKDANHAGRIGASEYITGSTANDLVFQATGSGETKFYQAGVNSLSITSASRVGIGINVGTSYHFQVSNLSGSGVVAYFMATSGVGVYLSNGANSWSTASDETLKKNINELDKQKSYDNIKNIRAVNYKYIADEDDDTKRIGFIAQDWQTKYPEMIVSDAKDNDKLGLNYTETIPVLLSALQKAQEKIETLETANTALEARISALENA